MLINPPPFALITYRYHWRRPLIEIKSLAIRRLLEGGFPSPSIHLAGKFDIFPLAGWPASGAAREELAISRRANCALSSGEICAT
jgi:hypothetical protein